MSDLNLKTFDKLYPMIIHKYDELFDDQNANIMDRINTIVNYLNQVGKLTNDVVKDWNVVYQWVMNDGLTTDVNNKIEAMRASGELDTVLQSVFNSIAGDKTTLHTTAKDTLVAAINEVDDLAKTKLSLGHTDYNGATQDNPMVEIGVIGAGAALHLLAGDTMTAPYVVGIGVDHDGKTGQTISVKADNCTGLGIDLTSTSGANSVGLYADSIGPGTVIRLAQGGGAHGSLLDLRNDYGGTGNMLSWSSANQGYFGKIGQDGTITRTLGAEGQDHELVSIVGSANNENHYHYSGTAGLWFYSAISTYANHMVFQQSAPAAIGAETPLKLIDLRDGNAIGFYGVDPVTRQTLSNTTDTSDTATKLNALLTALRNLGLIA